MPKKSGIVFVIMGAVLLIAALLLFVFNKREDEKAGQQSENIVSDIKAQLAEISVSGGFAVELISDEKDESEADESLEMLAVEIDGYAYVGYLAVPTLEIELPVMADWDYERLQIAPCRQFGSAKSDDLVIAAHNYQSHFGRFSELNLGDEVVFTDMENNTYEYRVAQMSTLEPTEVAEVQNSGHDLVLYTCTYGGATRVTVFCDRVSGDTK